MAFRRTAEERAFARWQHEWNELIVAARVPDFIVETCNVWLRFLDSGYLEECGPSRHFDYDVRTLPRDEQAKLLELIETYPGGAESYAGRRLRQLLTGAD